MYTYTRVLPSIRSLFLYTLYNTPPPRGDASFLSPQQDINGDEQQIEPRKVCTVMIQPASRGKVNLKYWSQDTVRHVRMRVCDPAQLLKVTSEG